MKTEQDDLQKIIEQSAIPDEWKKILQETMKSVISRNESVLSEVREKVLQEKNSIQVDRIKKWNVMTALVTANEVHDMAGLRKVFPHIEENLLNEPMSIDVIGNFFLESSYEDVVALCSDEYSNEYPYEGYVDIQGKKISFRYRLAHDLRYVNDERILFDAADLYQIKRPVIFSPYSRRAVKIQIPRQSSDVADWLRENMDDLTPYQLETNELTGKLVSDKQLMWNIRFESVPLPQYSKNDDKDASYFAPYGDIDIYRYEFKNLKENELICPANDDFKNIMTAHITSLKNEERQIITLISKKQLISPCILIHIMQNQNVHSAVNIFPNFDHQRQYMDFSMERLRTRGDIERVLYGLGMPEHGFDCVFLDVSDTVKKDINIIKPYYRELAYGITNNHREQMLYTSRRKMPFCYLKFTGDSKFLTDYASYVISFLEVRYPDFQWVGVR